MTDRCEPPEELRGVDGWHEIERPTGVRLIAEWQPQPERRCKGRWSTHVGSIDADSAAGMFGWRYLAPVATPAEVEALRAENLRIVREAKDCATTLAAYIRDLEVISGHTRRLGEENYTLRARVARLEEALKPFAAAGLWDWDFTVWRGVSSEQAQVLYHSGTKESVTLADLHAARAALSLKPTE